MSIKNDWANKQPCKYERNGGTRQGKKPFLSTYIYIKINIMTVTTQIWTSRFVLTRKAKVLSNRNSGKIYCVEKDLSKMIWHYLYLYRMNKNTKFQNWNFLSSFWIQKTIFGSIFSIFEPANSPRRPQRNGRIQERGTMRKFGERERKKKTATVCTN